MVQRLGYEKLAKIADAQSGGKKEVRKTENVMGGQWEEIGEQQVKIGVGDSERKVRRGTKRRRKDDNNQPHPCRGPTRGEQQREVNIP